MNHASAGSGPTLPPDPFAYFRTPEFQARMRNMNDAMQHGLRPRHEDLSVILGCPMEEFTAFVASVSDGNGVAMIDVGGGRYITMELGTNDALTPAVQAACGPDQGAALAAIIPRLIFLRKMCDQHSELPGLVTHHYALNGLICTFIDRPTGAYFRVDTSAKPRQPLMSGEYAGTVEGGKFLGSHKIEYWGRGWEDLLF